LIEAMQDAHVSDANIQTDLTAVASLSPNTAAGDPLTDLVDPATIATLQTLAQNIRTDIAAVGFSGH
jgi:hypothetical protein